MDTKRLIAFIILSFSILMLWQEFFAPPPPPKPAVTASTDTPTPTTAAKTVEPAAAGQLLKAQRIQVETDLLRVMIDTQGGDIRRMELLKQGAVHDPKQP
ncbi:MAG: membrane protein insertase YidC, partial [Aquaspirillum sp.]